MMKPEDLPPPETLIEYHDGMCGALMFHYAVEGNNFTHIAREQGFETRFVPLDRDENAADLHQEYLDGASDVCERWRPTVPDGWILGAKNDTEHDGPVACFIRKIART